METKTYYEARLYHDEDYWVVLNDFAGNPIQGKEYKIVYETALRNAEVWEWDRICIACITVTSHFPNRNRIEV